LIERRDGLSCGGWGKETDREPSRVRAYLADDVEPEMDEDGSRPEADQGEDESRTRRDDFSFGGETSFSSVDTNNGELTSSVEVDSGTIGLSVEKEDSVSEEKVIIRGNVIRVI